MTSWQLDSIIVSSFHLLSHCLLSECSSWGYMDHDISLGSSVIELTRVTGVPGSISGPAIYMYFYCIPPFLLHGHSLLLQVRKSSCWTSFSVWGECSHCFHIHCIVKWLNSQQVNQLCPMCRQDWKFKSDTEAMGTWQQWDQCVPNLDLYQCVNVEHCVKIDELVHMTGEVECVLHWYLILNLENYAVFLVHFETILHINTMNKNLISNCSFTLILIKICEKQYHTWREEYISVELYISCKILWIRI